MLLSLEKDPIKAEQLLIDLDFPSDAIVAVYNELALSPKIGQIIMREIRQMNISSYVGFLNEKVAVYEQPLHLRYSENKPEQLLVKYAER